MTTPGVPDFLTAYGDAIRGELGQKQNVRRGGSIDLVGGSSALLWSALAQRDRDLFRANLIDTAQGEDLERLVTRRYGVSQIHATRGAGTLILARPTAAAGGDTIDVGTRLRVTGPSLSETYRVATTTPVGAAALTVTVPVEATRPGPGVAISVTGAAIQLSDSLFDASLVPLSLTCADGTAEETGPEYVARARAARRTRRLGYRASVERACRAAGAATVVTLAPDAFGDEMDQAVTNVYVGDAAYSTTTSLVDACYVALESVRVAGCDLQVLPMAVVAVSVSVGGNLWADPSRFDMLAMRRDIVDALVSYFDARRDFWLFDNDALRNVVFTASGGATQSIGVTSSPSPPDGTFPAVLPRYTLAGSAITLSLFGPQSA